MVLSPAVQLLEAAGGQGPRLGVWRGCSNKVKPSWYFLVTQFIPCVCCIGVQWHPGALGDAKGQVFNSRMGEGEFPSSRAGNCPVPVTAQPPAAELPSGKRP